MSRRARASLLLTATLTAMPAAASDTVVGSFGEREGLPARTIDAIAQTPDGYLWLGTTVGLVRFDGTRFRMYTAQTEPELPSDRISRLAVEGDSLYIGTHAGAAVYRDGRFAPVGPLDASAGISTARGGNVVIALQDGEAWAEGAVAKATGPLAAAGGPIADPLITRDGDVWVAGEEASVLLRWSASDGSVTRVEGPHHGPRPLLELQDGSLLVGTEAGLLRVRDGAVGVVDSIPTPVYAAVQEPDGTIVVGTRDLGVLRLGSDLRVVERVGGLPRTILSLLRDEAGTVWVGTADSGLAALRPSAASALPLPDALAGGSVSVVAQSAEGGAWVAVPCRGLVHIGAGKPDRWIPSESSNYCVWSVLEEPRGTVWLGTWGAGLLRYDLERAEVTGAWRLPDDRAAAFLALTPDPEGGLLLGTTAGLYRLAGDALARVHDVGAVSALRWDASGDLWVAASKGVFQRTRQGFVQRSPVEVRDVLPFPGGILATTYGRGLVRLDEHTEVRVGANVGLTDDYLGRFFEDLSGALWISGNAGLARLAPGWAELALRGADSPENSRTLAAADGLPSTECNGGSGNSGFIDSRGRLLIATLAGVGVVETSGLGRGASVKTLRPAFAQLISASRTLDILGDRIDLESDERTLQLEYGLPVWPVPDQVRYRVRENGEAWRDPHGARQAVLSELAAGLQRVELQARVPGGEWSDSAVLDLRVEPRIIETVGGKALVLGALVSLLALGHRAWRRWTVARRRGEELTAANQLLLTLANEDPLTGVASRRLFNDRLDLHWRIACRHPSPLSVVMLDVDLFKGVNDEFGHIAGDRCLAELASRLQKELRRSVDLVARYGGEEFAVLLPDTDAKGAARVSERFWNAVRQTPFDLGPDLAVRVTVSVGLATCNPASPGSPQDLVAAADAALNEAKRAGRDRVQVAEAAAHPPP